MSNLMRFLVRDFLTVFVVNVCVLLCPAILEGQADLFQQANQQYQAEEYDEAIGLYEAVFEGGYTSHDLHYNLGNAYFKTGDLGRAILNWERALAIEPSDEDAQANLELANTLTVDNVEPLPRFWLATAWAWWVRWIPQTLLRAFVAIGWLALCAGAIARVMGRGEATRHLGRLIAVLGAIATLLFGANLAVRELGIGVAQRGVILADEVPVNSAPTQDANLTVFEVHEGTRVRIDQRTDQWAEIVLDDGKVGWVPADVLGVV